MSVTERPAPAAAAAGMRTRVFDILAARGISQRWFARQIGLTDGMVSHIKAGRRAPNGRFIAGAVRVLGLPFDVLFYWSPSPSGDEPVRERGAA